MADLFSVTAPLTLRSPDGDTKVIAACFPLPQGLLYFDLYWHLGKVTETTHILTGDLLGDGPWKIDGHILNVLGCHGTNAELANAYQQWSTYLDTAQADYPPEPLIAAIARKLGATV